MKLKSDYLFLVLSIYTIYFLRPILCSSVQTAGCDSSNPDHASVSQFYLALQRSEKTLSAPTCCPTENRAASPHDEESQENCCSTRLELLKASEFNPFPRTRDKLTSFVALIPTFSAIPTISTPSAVHLRPSPNSALDPPHYQISPRAPPFSLA